MDKKVVFITGASRGIGAATVMKFTDNGWRVAGFYRGNRIEDTENSKYYQMDVADEKSVEQAFSQAAAEMRRVDGLVNVAGVSLGRKLSGHTTESIDQETAINYRGTVVCVREVLKYMKSGAIVNVGSVSMYGMGPTLDPVYTGSKAAVWGFSKQVARELGPDIRVNVVAPGLCDTELARKTHSQEDIDEVARVTPLRKIAAPADIANGIYFLMSEEAGHITGIALDINGGYLVR